MFNLTYRKTFTSTVWTNDNKLLQESSFTAKLPRRATHHVIRQLRVKDLPFMSKIPTWQLEWDSNQRPSAPNTIT